MRELVHLATVLIGLAGGSERASVWARALTDRGAAALSSADLTPDEQIYLRREATRVGVLTGNGAPCVDRALELSLVLEIVSALPPPRKPTPSHEPLVFTLPEALQTRLTPPERLDILVMDVIRSAERELRIGGPFWNYEGMETLRAVLEPAIEAR